MPSRPNIYGISTQDLRGCRTRRCMWKSFVGATCLCIAAYLLVGLGALGARPEVSRPSQTVDLDAQMVQYPSDSFNIRAYLVAARSAGRHPAVIVVHSSEGLDERMKDVSRRFAMEGFVVLA